MVLQLSQSQLDEFNQRQSDMIQNLRQLQQQEMTLYGELEANVAANGDTAVRDQLVARIGTISEARMNMYRDLLDNYAIIRDSVAQTRGDLVDQMTLIDVVQQQLDSLRRQVGNINAEKSGKERMIEINTYYGKKYMAQKELMQIIILTCVPLLVLALLAKFGTLGKQVASVLGGIILVIGLYYIIRKIIDISSRNKLVFDEYDWSFDPATIKPTVVEYDMGQLGMIDTGFTDTALGCVGQQCCSDGTTFDKTTQRCVPSGSSTSGVAASAASA